MSTAAPLQQAEAEAQQTESRHPREATQFASGGSEFIDARPQAGVQRRLQEMADSSRQAAQLQALHQTVQTGARAMQLKTTGAMMNTSVLQQVAGVPKANKTGLPENLKTGVETLSGISMDDVKVHYNSPQPAQLNAHAYAQGSDIHVAPGQEKHLPHEAWHVVQQKQGRVRPTLQMKGGTPVNNDRALEAEADAMGAKAWSSGGTDAAGMQLKRGAHRQGAIQRLEKTAAKHGRDRESDGKTRAPSSSGQMEKQAAQLRSKLVQLAIDDYVPNGTRIMVSNPSAGDAGDIGTVIGRSTVRDRCMRVVFDNEPDVAYRVYFHEITVISPSAERSKKEGSQFLKAMIDSVISAVLKAPEEIAKVMDPDKTGAVFDFEVSPSQQLQKCLDDCTDLSAEQTALYLYTTYFFGPLNRYLRNPRAFVTTSQITELITVTHALLTRAFNNTPGAKLLPKFRMELQAEWMGARGEGEDLSFAAFTSTHPDLDGINAMWPDIEAGTFGKTSKLALLVFEGDTKLLNPVAKYFPRENEMILPPGIQASIQKKYDITWDTCTVTVYHLMIQPGMSESPSFQLTFDPNGYVAVVEK